MRATTRGREELRLASRQSQPHTAPLSFREIDGRERRREGDGVLLRGLGLAACLDAGIQVKEKPQIA